MWKNNFHFSAIKSAAGQHPFGRHNDKRFGELQRSTSQQTCNIEILSIWLHEYNQQLSIHRRFPLSVLVFFFIIVEPSIRNGKYVNVEIGGIGTHSIRSWYEYNAQTISTYHHNNPVPVVVSHKCQHKVMIIFSVYSNKQEKKNWKIPNKRPISVPLISMAK